MRPKLFNLAVISLLLACLGCVDSHPLSLAALKKSSLAKKVGLTGLVGLAGLAGLVPLIKAKKEEKLAQAMPSDMLPMDMTAHYVNLPIVHPPAPNALPQIGVYLPKEIPMPYAVPQMPVSMPFSPTNREKFMKQKAKGVKAPKPAAQYPYGEFGLPYKPSLPGIQEQGYVPVYAPSVPVNAPVLPENVYPAY